MGAQTADLLRAIGQPATEVEMLTLLREIAQGVARLVELEEEAREAGRQMDGLIDALRPSNDGSGPVVELDWYRDREGNYLERGTDRPLIQEEVAVVTYSPRRESRRQR